MTRDWKAVVSLLGSGGDVRDVAVASATAARAALDAAKGDPGFVEAFFLMAQLPRAARTGSFVESLREYLAIPDDPTLLDVTTAFSSTIDARFLQKRDRTDVGEMAQLAAIETLSDVVGRRLPSLFEPDTGDLRAALSSLATEQQFGALSRVFFARFTERVLNYYLSRELANHIGPDKRFADVADRVAFNDAIRRHCFETAKIVEVYAGEWTSKQVWLGQLTRMETRKFAMRAFGKLSSELRRREVDLGR